MEKLEQKQEKLNQNFEEQLKQYQAKQSQEHKGENRQHRHRGDKIYRSCSFTKKLKTIVDKVPFDFKIKTYYDYSSDNVGTSLLDAKIEVPLRSREKNLQTQDIAVRVDVPTTQLVSLTPSLQSSQLSPSLE